MAQILGNLGGNLGSLGSLGNLSGGLGGGLTSRRIILVIYGITPPQPEIDEATSIATAQKKMLGVSRALSAGSSYIKWFSKTADIIVIGGPFANPYASSLNDLVDPHYDITVNRAQNTGEDWATYIKAGGLTVNGFIYKNVKYPFGTFPSGVGIGIIGKGTQSLMRLRPLNVTFIGGHGFEDTCAMTKALLAGGAAGIYDTTFTPQPATPTTCPADAKYVMRKIA